MSTSTLQHHASLVEGGTATGTKRNETTEALVKEAEAMVVAEAAKEEAKEATTITTMEAEVAEAATMGTRTTSIRGINNRNQQHSQSYFQQQMPTTIFLPHSASSSAPHFQNHHMDSYANQTGNNANSDQCGYQRQY